METAGERLTAGGTAGAEEEEARNTITTSMTITRMRAVTIPMTTLMTVPMTEAGTGELEETEVLTVCQPREAALPGKRPENRRETLISILR